MALDRWVPYRSVPRARRWHSGVAGYTLSEGAGRAGRAVFAPLLVQHSWFVHTIKSNRARSNLDRIVCNKGNLTYECVWQQADNGEPWMCIFALDIYDWKDLGRTGALPPRGCAGFYVTPTQTVPANATRAALSRIIIPSGDALDAFAR